MKLKKLNIYGGSYLLYFLLLFISYVHSLQKPFISPLLYTTYQLNNSTSPPFSANITICCPSPFLSNK